MTGNPKNNWEKATCYNAGAIKKDGLFKIKEWVCMVYHGVRNRKREFAGRGAYIQYSLGIMLLNLEANVIYRQKEPILAPELDWELNGYVPNVVFSCGQVLWAMSCMFTTQVRTRLGVAKCSIKDIEKLFV